MRYAVRLYTQASVEVEVEADTLEQAIRYARVDAESVDYELIDRNDIVRDWDVETGDWEFSDAVELEE